MSRLDGPEFFEWMGLRRVRRGGVARFEHRYYDAGRSIPGYLIPDVLEALLGAGLLVLGELEESGWRRVRVTADGDARYLALVRKQRGLAAPEHPTTETRPITG